MLRPHSASSRRPAGRDVATHLADFTGRFANPGALRLRLFVPPGVATGAPLVVVLHGCAQSAAGYDHAAGWSALATAHGFALLFPEQVRANNPNGCFNWFEAADTRRGSGEAASIANAVAAVVEQYRLDPARVFITGLSAGGAMANVMLATYPDVFAGGAIIAGLPFGSAVGIRHALTAMASPAALTPAQWGDQVRDASTFAGPWPIVSVWHGGDDRTVGVANGAAVAAQWADVHGATTDDGTTWRNAAGVVVVEFNEIAGMGHGTPIDSRDGGVAAPFMLDVGIASSARIVGYWGLAPSRHPGDAPIAGPAIPSARGASPVTRPRDRSAAGRPDFGTLINTALRVAGLLK